MEAAGNYITYVLKNDRIMVRCSLRQAFQQLKPSDLIQIHKSFLISIKAIDKIEDNHVYIGKSRLPIGSGYKDELMKLIESKEK